LRGDLKAISRMVAELIKSVANARGQRSRHSVRVETLQVYQKSVASSVRCTS